MAFFGRTSRALRRVLPGLALMLAGAGPASAATPRVLSFPYQHLQTSLPEDLGEQTTLVVTREVGQGGVEVVRREDLGGGSESRGEARDADTPTGDPKAGPRSEGLVETAREHVEDGEVGRAIRKFEKAIKGLEENGDAVADLRILGEAYLQLGIARFRDGEEEGADEALTKAIHYAPERTLQTSDYPPIFVKVYDRARAAVLRRPRGDVEVRAAPGARVLLDGRAAGTAPVMLKDVLPGTHWIRIERPGQAVQAKKIRVRSRKTTLVPFAGGDAGETPKAATADALEALRANELGAEHLEQLRAAGRAENADFVLVGAIFGTDTAYQIRSGLLEVSTGRMGRLVDVAFDLDLLSAEIEVFKLADDVQKQAKARQLTRPESGASWVPAPTFKPRRRRKRAVRMGTFVAAPGPIRAPTSIYAEAQPTPPPEPAVTPVVEPKGQLVPKDELPRVNSTPPRPSPGVAPSTTVTAGRAGQKDEGGGDLWWVWVLVGVAAAGAAGAATYVVVSDDSSDTGSLRVRW